MLRYDGRIEIARGRSRHDKNWQTLRIQWSELLERLATPTRTSETLAEFHAASRTEQLRIKDVGGVVGGALKGGRRSGVTVVNRTLLTLDADYAPMDVWDEVGLLCPFAAAMHSTHKHTPITPRLRFYIPLARPVSPEEYVAVARMVAFDWGIEYFDDSTYEPQRLMFWPSVSVDGEYLFESVDAPWLNPGTVLARYADWKDIASYPRSSRDAKKQKRLLKKQEDPLDKPGLVGAFCRTYTVSDVLAEFLAEEYEPCGIEGRYTYRKGTTSAGLVVYEDKFAYSHHGTDPAGGQLCNAFDLVRLHRFGELDEDANPDTPTNRLPSFQKMLDFAREQPAVKKTLYTDKTGYAAEDFDDNTGQTDDTEWVTQLETDAKGCYLPTIGNLTIILQNDPGLKGRLVSDEFEHREAILDDLPWRKLSAGRAFEDKDEAQFKLYLEQRYKIISHAKVHDALSVAFADCAVHPVREYLDGLSWDEVPRLETLLIDYLGAADTPYVRAVTRKMLAAAVARIYEPGTKFDYMMVLVGPQGTGKSTIINRLGGRWYSDSFTTVQGKDAYEQLQGTWLMEVAEMAGLSKSEVETVKHFISKQEDRFRVAYGKRVSYFPRQCVFFGTTNNYNCLRDETGNRRFWPVDVRVAEPRKNLFEDFTRAEINQVWAEAVELYQGGESLYLGRELEAEAQEQQALHTEEDPKFGLVQGYLDLLLPEDWEDMDLHKRRSYVRGEDRELMAEGVRLRDCVCIPEIWEELFGGAQDRLDVKTRRELHSIMQHMPGWERYGKAQGNLKTKKYGPQKSYVRLRAVTQGL